MIRLISTNQDCQKIQCVKIQFLKIQCRKIQFVKIQCLENLVYGKFSVWKIQCGENLEARKFSGWKVQWLYKQNIQWQIAGHAEDGEKLGMDFCRSAILAGIWHTKFIKQEFSQNQLLENVLQYLIRCNLEEISVGG